MAHPVADARSEVVLVGGGGHATVVIDAMLAAGRAPFGVYDDDAGKRGGEILGVPVLGPVAALIEDPPPSCLAVIAVGSAGPTSGRRVLAGRVRAAGIDLGTVRHPAAICSPYATIGLGCHLLARSVVQAGAVLGRNVIVNTAAIIEHDAEIGEDAHVCPGAIVLGAARVGAGVHVGAGSCVLQGVTIGEDAVIGAGAVVTKDVAAGVAVAGVPARAVPTGPDSG